MYKKYIFLSLLFTTFVLITSCGNKEKNKSFNNVNHFEEIKIGNQVWMKENLNTHKFQNGDLIPYAKSMVEWDSLNKAKQPAFCYYNNNPKNEKLYGKLYNWWAVIDKRGLAPKGFHVPSDKEWALLVDFLGGNEFAGAKMKSKTGWPESGNNTNASKFSALPGGCCRLDDEGNGKFYGDDIGNWGYWWSSSKFYLPDGRSGCNSLSLGWTSIVENSLSRRNEGLSVRCLKN